MEWHQGWLQRQVPKTWVVVTTQTWVVANMVDGADTAWGGGNADTCGNNDAEEDRGSLVGWGGDLVFEAGRGSCVERIETGGKRNGK